MKKCSFQKKMSCQIWVWHEPKQCTPTGWQLVILGTITNGICNAPAAYKYVFHCLLVAGSKFEPSYTSRSPFFDSDSRSKALYVQFWRQFWRLQMFFNVLMHNWRLFRGCTRYIYMVWQVTSIKTDCWSRGNHYFGPKSTQNRLKIGRLLHLDLLNVLIFHCLLNTRTNRKQRLQLC